MKNAAVIIICFFFLLLLGHNVSAMESPKEGGFHPMGQRGGVGDLQSVAMLKKHIKELYEQLAQAEQDKQKIADEAYR